MDRESFKSTLRTAMMKAGVERDSLFAHSATEVLDVDKAWQVGFLQGWLSAIEQCMEDTREVYRKNCRGTEEKKSIHDHRGRSD